MKKIIAFGASSSKASINKQLATFAAHQFQNATVEVLDLNDYEMPIFSTDRETESGIPQLAQDFYAKIGSADLIVISFAEHNGAYATAFKNIFDWTSRINGKTFQEKPMIFLPEKALYSFVGEYESQNKGVIIYIKKIGRELYMSALINGKSESQEIILPVDATTFSNDGFHLQFLKENGIIKKIRFIELEGEKRIFEMIKVK